MELVLIDTAQIQSYIFESNQLREQIGASHLVASASTTLLKHAIDKVVQDDHNVEGVTLQGLNLDGRTIEKNGLKAEVVYAAGGNAAVVFEDKHLARAFRRALSVEAILKIPGITLVSHQQSVDKYNFGAVYLEMLGQLSIKKACRPRTDVLKGLGVTRQDPSTGAPVVGLTPENQPASAATLEKIRAVRDELKQDKSESAMGAITRLKHYLELPEGFTYPLDIDDLGRSEGEHSYVSVVHADGDGMGQRFRAYLQAHKDEEKDVFVTALRRFSDAIRETAQAALQEMFEPLRKTLATAREAQNTDGVEFTGIIHPSTRQKAIKLKLRKNKAGNWYVPFRPIVFGGDDITFVCDGRLGLTLATALCKAFEFHAAEKIPAVSSDDAPISASAGVCIVKAHYPFSSAYHLAEELAGSAKSYRRKLLGVAKQAHVGGCLDWHFANSGLSGDLKTIRNKEYSITENQSLLLRPVSIDQINADEVAAHRSWSTVRHLIDVFQDPESDWSGRRSKMKDVLQTLRKGKSAMETLTRAQQQQHLELKLPLVQGLADAQQSGFVNDENEENARALYFDALELADWYIPLEK